MLISVKNIGARLIKTARRRHKFPVRKFLANESGVTAIEFAMLGLPFFAIIGAILETALIFFASQVLDSALNDSARLIRTGQAQAQNYNVNTFRTAVCSELYGLFDCKKLKIRVSTINTFSSATLKRVVDPKTGDWKLVQSYDDGAASSIIMVEAYYKWPTMLDFFSFNLANLPGNERLLSSVRVFRNEPF